MKLCAPRPQAAATALVKQLHGKECISFGNWQKNGLGSEEVAPARPGKGTHSCFSCPLMSTDFLSPRQPKNGRFPFPGFTGISQLSPSSCTLCYHYPTRVLDNCGYNIAAIAANTSSTTHACRAVSRCDFRTLENKNDHLSGWCTVTIVVYTVLPLPYARSR